MKTYIRYKDSGISWIGKIPEHWEISCLRKHLSFVSDKGHPEEQLLSVTREKGVIIRNRESKEENHNFIPDDLSGYKLVREGQFAINKMKSWQGSYAVSQYTGIVSPAYYICDLHFDYKPFFHVAIRSRAYIPFFTMYSKGIRVDQWDLSPIGLKNIPFFVPPVSEQKAIVAFLDEKTAKINGLVTTKQKQIELLKEYKQSLIAKAVTKGINPKAKMKDSGINWIGQIPAHWESSTLRKHLKFISDKGHSEEQLLSVTREHGVIVRNTESKEENHNVIPTDLSDYKLVKKGQFAINKMKSWQGSYAVSSYTGIVSPAYYVCDLDFENKEFFSIAIRSKAYVPFFTMYSKGIRVDQWDLSPVGLKTIPFFIPPKEEQESIVSYLKEKTERIAIQISAIEKQIENLNEYKQSLISDVVTGKVQV